MLFCWLRKLPEYYFSALIFLLLFFRPKNNIPEVSLTKKKSIKHESRKAMKPLETFLRNYHIVKRCLIEII